MTQKRPCRLVHSTQYAKEFLRKKEIEIDWWRCAAGASICTHARIHTRDPFCVLNDLLPCSCSKKNDMTCNENAGHNAWKPSICCVYSFFFCYCRVAEATCGAQNNDNHFKSAPRHIDKRIHFFFSSLSVDHCVINTSPKCWEQNNFVGLYWCKSNWIFYSER